MKKKMWAFLGMAVLGMMLVGCGSQSGDQETAQVSSEQSLEQEADQEIDGESGQEQELSGETAQQESELSGETTEQESEEPVEITIRDITSMELVSDMKIGWSLGNTLDATGGVSLDSERSWGNPKTTQEMIDAILDQGFNVIRIPVTWQNHMGEGPDYTIHEVWMDRVQEVVDYAYNRGAYVILNIHHEEWHFPSEENKDAASEQLTAVWTQIATRFRDYDEHLIFEGLNEPRKIGTAVEWNSGDEEGREIVNYFDQVFVDAVRATGGNNTYRHLMVPGYAAASDDTALRSIVLPDDDKLIVSVHAYIPYDFALNVSGTDVWGEDTYAIDHLAEVLDEVFISQGVPVIIGEFGALNKDNEEERSAWAAYYVTHMKEYGIPCLWWDNGAFTSSGENLGLLDRRELTFPFPDLLKALTESAE